MKKVPSIPWLLNKKRAQFDLEELHKILDLLSFAAFGVDIKQNIIGWANEKAIELTGYTRRELSGASIATLLSDDIKSLLSEEKKTISTSLTTRLGKKILIKLDVIPLGEKSTWAIFRAQRAEEAEQLLQYANWHNNLWPSMNELLAATLESNFEKALDLILDAAKSLLDAELLGVYLLNDRAPFANKIAETAKDSPLPQEISANALGLLKLPQNWGYRNSPNLDIQRSLRSAGYRSIASAPLGTPQAMIGLIIAGAPHELSSQSIEILRGISSCISNIMNHQARLSIFEDRLKATAADQYNCQLVWNKISDSAILLDQDLVITNINQAAEISLGYAFSEVKGVNIEKLMISDTSLEDLFLSIRNQNPPVLSQPLRLYRRNGSYFQTALHLYPIVQEGHLSRTLILYQDLTEQEHFRVRNEQLEQRALLGEVTASFAHEVRNPINNISTGLQVLEMSLPADDPNQENISRLQQDCNRLTELIRSGLSFIKPLEYQIERINLNELLGNLLDRWQNRLMREKIQRVFQPDIIPPIIDGDPRAVEQIFNNLFTNAVQALKKDQILENSGTLAVKIRRINQNGSTDQIEVSVSDTGGGITESIREHIFEPFFTTKTTGTGLGLAIVKRIITAHKGSVQVSSYPGITVFSVRFPSAQ